MCVLQIQSSIYPEVYDILTGISYRAIRKSPQRCRPRENDFRKTRDIIFQGFSQEAIEIVKPPCGAKEKQQAKVKTTPSLALEGKPEAPENRLSEGAGPAG
jgi:hypothetical protein